MVTNDFNFTTSISEVTPHLDNFSKSLKITFSTFFVFIIVIRV